MNIHERLLQRKRTEGSRPILSAEEVIKIREFFVANPNSEDVYLFYSGDIVDGKQFRKSITSPLAGIVSMSTVGIPACVGRGHSQIEEFDASS